MGGQNTDIFLTVFLKHFIEGENILIEISLKFIPQGPIYNMSALI